MLGTDDLASMLGSEQTVNLIERATKESKFHGCNRFRSAICMWQSIANPSWPAWRSLAGIRLLEHLPGRLTSPALSLRGGHTKAEQLLHQLTDHERQGVPDGAGTDAAAGFDLVTDGCSYGSAKDCIVGADGCCCSAGTNARSAGSPGEASGGLACCARGRH